MKILFKALNGCLLLAALLVFLPLAEAAAEKEGVCANFLPTADARAMVQNAWTCYRLPAGEGEKEVTEIIVTSLSNIKRKELVQWRFFGANVNEDKMMIKFTFPATDKGVGFLTERGKEKNIQHIKLPRMNPRLINAVEKGNYFAGTDFTNQDLEDGTGVSTDNYDYKFIGEESSFWKIKGVPKNSGSSIYGSIVTYVSKDNGAVIGMDYFNAAGVLLKKLIYKEIIFDNNRWYPKIIKMDNKELNRVTEVITKKLEPLSGDGVAKYFTLNFFGNPEL